MSAGLPGNTVDQIMATLRDAEDALVPGDHFGPALPHEVAGTPAPLPGAPASFDYDKLAEAMAKLQAQQATAAVSAEPGFTPPGAEGVDTDTTHATLA